MKLRKITIFVLLISGLTLFGGALFVGVLGLPETAQKDAEIQTTPKTKSVKPIDTEKAETAWRNWMKQNGVTQSSIAIGRAGTILHSAAQKRNPDTAYAMASLSKAVTGVCLNQLLMQSAYSWESTIADLTPEFAKMNFTPAPQMADLTLKQIATHTSGVPTELNYGKMSTRSLNLSSQPTMARAALKEPTNFGPRGDYLYSNANYAILGFLIEAMTGQPYGEHCKANIMGPLGVTEAGVTGRMAKAAGYGGWSISVEDYARFAMHWFDQTQPWMKTPKDFGYDKVAKYGMGVGMHPTSTGTYVSHTGRWTHIDPRKPNIGSLFFVRTDGTTVVVSWDGSLDIPLYKQLSQSLRDAL